MLTIHHASRLYSVPLIDYGADRGGGLLVSSGSGIMMGVMDAAESLRWCVDIDGLKAHAALDQFLLMAERVVFPIAVTGWFSITDPRPLREAIRGMTTLPWVYGGNIRFTVGRECQSLAELISRVNRAKQQQQVGQSERGSSPDLRSPRGSRGASRGICQDNSTWHGKEVCQPVIPKGR